jgi:hypothetical protein
MTENLLVSIDEETLEHVNGGLSLGLSVNDKTVVGGSLSASNGTVSGSLTLFGHTIGASLGLKISL